MDSRSAQSRSSLVSGTWVYWYDLGTADGIFCVFMVGLYGAKVGYGVYEEVGYIRHEQDELDRLGRRGLAYKL